MSDKANEELRSLSEETAKDYFERGGWTKEEAVLILNGLDPVANLYQLADGGNPKDPMLATYWFAVMRFAPDKRITPVEDWLDWARKGTKEEPRQEPLTFANELREAYDRKDFKLLIRRLSYMRANQALGEPWWISHPDDPEPSSSWYIPARYFARQLAKANPALMTKRKSLAQKIQLALADHRIFKRGGSKPPEASSIMNALSNINLWA
jgi:hypothetical protein